MNENTLALEAPVVDVLVAEGDRTAFDKAVAAAMTAIAAPAAPAFVRVTTPDGGSAIAVDPPYVRPSQNPPRLSDKKKAHVSKETMRYDEQIAVRSRSKERNLFGLLSYSVSAGVSALEFANDLAPIGSMTHFVLRRRWKHSRHGWIVAMQFVGYKARLTDDGRVVLGGPDGVVCGYDLKYPPFEKSSPGGVILDSRKRTTLRMGLDLDAGIEVVAEDKAAPMIRLQVPEYYAAFDPVQIEGVDCEITPFTRRVVLDSLRPSYKGPVHPCCVAARDGVVEGVLVNPEGCDRTFVKYVGDEGLCIELPAQAVLRPWVVPGVEIKAGTVVADPLPRAVYNSWEQCLKVFGQNTMEIVADQTVRSLDFAHQGLVLRDVRFCPSQLVRARQVFERAPMVDGTKRAAVQVIREDGQGRNGLKFSEGPIDVDLDSLRPGWDKKFTG